MTDVWRDSNLRRRGRRSSTPMMTSSLQGWNVRIVESENISRNKRINKTVIDYHVWSLMMQFSCNQITFLLIIRSSFTVTGEFSCNSSQSGDRFLFLHSCFDVDGFVVIIRSNMKIINQTGKRRDSFWKFPYNYKTINQKPITSFNHDDDILVFVIAMFFSWCVWWSWSFVSFGFFHSEQNVF